MASTVPRTQLSLVTASRLNTLGSGHEEDGPGIPDANAYVVLVARCRATIGERFSSDQGAHVASREHLGERFP